MTALAARARRAAGGLLGATLAALLAVAGPAPALPVAPATPLAVGERERLLVVAPHPDDEVLGAAGLVQRVLARHGTVDVLLVTAGDGYPDAVRGALAGAAPSAADFVAYGTRRIAETRAALATLGGDRLRSTVLGFPDGALADLRGAHWSQDAPLRSPTTQASAPPYGGEVADAATPYAGESLVAAIARVVRAVRPTTIALPDPLDVHPDHASTGLFVLEAAAAAAGERSPDGAPVAAPRLVAYLVHWPDWPPGWDATAPAAGAARAALALPHDLPARHGGVATLALTPHELARKQQALARHATQERQMAVYLDAFVRRTEPFTVLDPADAAAARATLRAAPGAR